MGESKKKIGWLDWVTLAAAVIAVVMMGMAGVVGVSHILESERRAGVSQATYEHNLEKIKSISSDNLKVNVSDKSETIEVPSDLVDPQTLVKLISPPKMKVLSDWSDIDSLGTRHVSIDGKLAVQWVDRRYTPDGIQYFGGLAFVPK